MDSKAQVTLTIPANPKRFFLICASLALIFASLLFYFGSPFAAGLLLVLTIAAVPLTLYSVRVTSTSVSLINHFGHRRYNFRDVKYVTLDKDNRHDVLFVRLDFFHRKSVSIHFPRRRINLLYQAISTAWRNCHRETKG